MSRTVAVIGGGIVGLCCADHLVRRGYQVSVLDDAHDDKGCSFGNGGIIVPSHFVPIASPGMVRLGLQMLFKRGSPFGLDGFPGFETLAWIARYLRASTASRVAAAAPLLRDLNLNGKQGYEELVSRLGVETGFQERGLLMICRTEAGLKEEIETAETANRLGLKTQTLTRSEIPSFAPETAGDVAGAVHFKDDAHLTPPALMRALRVWLCDQGVQLVRQKVRSFRADGSRVSAALSESGEHVAHEFVIAAGVWTSSLARELGIRLPLVSGKGYGFTVAGDEARISLPAILVEARIAATPMLSGTRFVGVLELGQASDRLSFGRIAEMKRRIPLYYRSLGGFENNADEVWCGHRPCTPDGLPYVGRSAKYQNLVIAAGHAMMGMSLGPSTGALVGQIIDAEPTFRDVQALSPDRYDRR